MIPVRGISEALNAKVDWDGDKQEITVKKGGDEVVMYLDSDVAYINDTPITLDAPATLMNNRTMVRLDLSWKHLMLLLIGTVTQELLK